MCLCMLITAGSWDLLLASVAETILNFGELWTTRINLLTYSLSWAVLKLLRLHFLLCIYGSCNLTA